MHFFLLLPVHNERTLKLGLYLIRPLNIVTCMYLVNSRYLNPTKQKHHYYIYYMAFFLEFTQLLIHLVLFSFFLIQCHTPFHCTKLPRTGSVCLSWALSGLLWTCCLLRCPACSQESYTSSFPHSRWTGPSGYSFFHCSVLGHHTQPPAFRVF